MEIVASMTLAPDEFLQIKDTYVTQACTEVRTAAGTQRGITASFRWCIHLHKSEPRCISQQ